MKIRVGEKVATTQLYFPDEVTNAADRFLGPIADKSLVMWTVARDGDGFVAAATVALRTS